MVEYANSVQAVALRVCKLDTDGSPLVGADNAFVTSQFTRVSWTPEYEEGEEITEKAGDGTQCVYFKMPDILKKVNLEVAICNPQPELYEMLADGYLLTASVSRAVTDAERATNVVTLTATAHGFQIGDIVTVNIADNTYDGTFTLTAVTANTFSYAQVAADSASAATTGTAVGPDNAAGVTGYAAPLSTDIPNADGLGVEVWSRRIIDGRPAASGPYWRWVFPLSKFRMDGERALENGSVANVFTGESIGNTAFGDGPVNDWDFGPYTGSAMSFAADSTAPTGVNDYVEVLADA